LSSTVSFLLRFDLELGCQLCPCRHLTGLSADSVLFLLTVATGPAQHDFAVAHNDLNVLSIHRQGSIFDDPPVGFSALARDRPYIGLLLRGVCILVFLSRIAFGVI